VGLAAIDPAERFRVLGHFWSLSLEEQFYMVVAITMVVCLRKNWIRPLAVLCGAAALWIAWSRYNVDLGPWPGNTVSSAVLKRGFQLFWIERPDALLWGVVLAVINAYLPQGVTERFRRPILAVGWVALFTLGFSLIWSSKAAHSMGWPFYLHNVPDAVRNHASGLQCALKTTGDQLGAFRPCTDTMWFFRVGHNLTAISIAPVMFCFARYKDWLPNRILGFKVFSLNGRLSYTLYIWHALGIFLVTAVIGEHASKPVRLVLCLIVIYAISWPVYVFVEQKALKRKLRYAAEKEVLDLRTGKMVNVDDAIKDGEKSTKKRRRHER
jgi:peptidoglycan/LPS O-acetylase OafA/YrhL